jgi:hypothetical protein
MTIGIDFDRLFEELKRITRELQQFPAASEVAIVEGGVSRATSDFRDSLSTAAAAMSSATDRTITALNDTHDTIRAAAMQMAEQDAALADETDMILRLLDSAVAQASDTAQTDDTGDRADY